jgi:Holliday junction DNA helicase RuvA
MIGRLSGVLAIKRAPLILIDCRGVGYELEVSMSTYYQLPAEGEPVILWTHLLVKEDQHSLIGFYTDQERKMFRLLIRVNGVGPKMALTILSGISETDFALSIQSGDVSTLMRLPGVGKKTAERLIIEMRDKVEGLSLQAVTSSATGHTLPNQNTSLNEAIEALQSLGYKPVDAVKMINRAAQAAPEGNAENLIKLALKNAIG